MRVTLKDVAAKAGLSPATVSLVLNNRPARIPEATRERVWEAVRELQYRPNKRAASLVTNRMGTIGIIVPDMCNIFFSNICAACETEARVRDYSVLFGSSGDEVELDLNYIDVFFSKGVDGIILAKAGHMPPEDEDRLMAKIQDVNIPFVTVGRRLNMQRGRSITVDHRLGAYMATRHLIGLGHKCIGCITGPANDVMTRERLEGYYEALDEAGIIADPTLICTGDYRFDSGAEHLPYLLGKFVTAIFCFNDLMAMGVYKGCRNYNLQIPKDLSVVGFDDIPFCEALEVPLTTVCQPAERIGTEAMRQIFHLLNQEEEARDFVFEPVLKVRASTSAPKSFSRG